jgi:hypothetical protein
MKKFFYSFLCATLAVAALSSCDKDDNIDYSKYYANSIVTVKTDTKGLLLQLDDSTTIRPTNIQKSPFKNSEVRALCNISFSGDIKKGTENQAYVNWMDSVITKNAVAYVSGMKLPNDPLEVVDDWTTVVEDGYITIRFRTYFDIKTHVFNIITGANKTDPYEILLTHDAFGELNGRIGDGIMAFNLSNLPSTNGKYVTLTLKWNSFSGEKTVKFKYKSRQ